MAATSTIYLRPPSPPRPKKAKAKSPHEELTDFLFKYRVQFLPFLATFAVWLFAVLLGPEWWGGLLMSATAAGIGGLMYQTRYQVPVRVPWFRLDRPVERWYALGCATVTAVWSLCATWNATKPGLRASLALFLLTCICSAPWWHHRRIRGSIPVRFTGLTGAERKMHLDRSRKLVQEWTAFASAGHIQGAKLRGIQWNRYSVTLAIQLRMGATVGEFNQRRLEKLESAFGDVKAGAARVERVERHARHAVIRFMIDDPHAEPISPPEDGNTDPESIIIGLFETGEAILFKLVNTLVAGATGAGKSGVVNMIIRALARIPTVAIIGIDMKPGAPELGKWEKVMHTLARTPDEASMVLDQMKAGLMYRGGIMSANGWRKWKPTRHQPFIVLIVDEIQELKRARLERKLDDLAAIIRAYGGCIVVATQYPTKPNLSATIKANCLQKIGLRTEDQVGDRVIFGESATRLGWRPSTIPSNREGSFLIKSPEYKRPLLGRAYWLEDDEIDSEAALWGPQRTAVDDATWNPVDGAERVSVAAVEPGRVVLTKSPEDGSEEIVDAVIVDDDPRERVLDALRRRSKPNEIADDAGVSKASVYRHLSALREQGLAENPSRGRWVRTATDQDQEGEAA
jgi:DNA-binding transcriptional ArsR family regulator